MHNDIVSELFPESKRASFFVWKPLFAIMIILLFAVGLLGVASAKVGERYLYSGAVCQKSETMTEFLNQWDGELTKMNYSSH